MADTFGMRLASQLPDGGCSADSLATNYWKTALMAIRDGSYLPLASITTAAQWVANYNTPAESVQYAEDYTAVHYWQDQHGFDSLIQLVKQQKTSNSDFAPALQQVLGVSEDQFEGAYQADLRSHLNDAPLAIPVTVHISDAGATASTSLRLSQYSGSGQGTTYESPPGISAGDYAFTFQNDGTVTSDDSKVTLTGSPTTFPPAQQGRLYAEIEHPSYQGLTGADGREILRLNDMFGRAGLAAQYYFVNSDSSLQPLSGNCVAPWPDGNQITPSMPPPQS